MKWRTASILFFYSPCLGWPLRWPGQATLFGDLDGVEGGPLAQVIAGDPQGDAVEVGGVLPDVPLNLMLTKLQRRLGIRELV